MCPFRRVEDEQAGSDAIGILVPPSRQTFVIVRPRSLAWDLLVVRSEKDLTFSVMSREEAGGKALSLFRDLQSADAIEVAIVTDSDDTYWLRVHVGRYFLVVCRREPGKPYAPAAFATSDAAAEAGEVVADLLSPGETEREVYFNTRHFSV